MVVLRIVGVDLDVDSLATQWNPLVAHSHRRGEPRSPRSKPSGRIWRYSAVHVEVSSAEFGDFAAQINDCLGFLRTHRDRLIAMRRVHGFAGAVLDFAVVRAGPEVAVQCFTFPAELVTAAAEFGIELEISIYPRQEDAESEDSGH